MPKPRKSWGPEGGGLEGWGPEGGGAKISRRCSSLSAGLFRGWPTQSARFGFSGVILCSEILGGPARGGSAEGRSCRGAVWQKKKKEKKENQTFVK